MPIVKILNSSRNFSAVGYNESRVEKGEAQLICASNFSIAENNSKSYIAFLKKWSATNSRIKNPQFHVVISLKGKVTNPDTLLNIANEWLKGMGYDKNPYLIYHHTNTNNSHIHIVTTRVGENGRKIEHSFERKKSQRILNEIQGVDKLKELRTYISGLLHYSFSTVTQFIELCKDADIRVTDNDDKLILSKDDKSISINKDLIEFCSSRYKCNIEGNTQKSIQAKIFKYANLLDKDSFQSYMRNKFGLKFIYYGKDDRIYGFTIIDYKNRSVYKGSEIFSLKKLNELFAIETKTYQDKYNLLLKDFIRENKYSGLFEVNSFLLKQGLFTDGISYYELPDNELIGYVDKKLSDKILYNTRVNKILKDYKPSTTDEKKVLSKIYHVSLKDLNRPFNGRSSDDDILYYKGIISDLISHGGELKKTLESMGIEIHFLPNSFVLRDAANKTIVSNERLGVDYNSFKNALNSFDDRFDFGRRYEDEYVGVDYDYEPEILLGDVLSGILHIQAGGGGSNRKKKRT